MILEGTQKVALYKFAVEYESRYKQSDDSFQFTLVEGEREDGIIPIPIYFFTCREHMIELTEKAILRRYENHNFNMDKGRFLVKIKTSKYNNLSRAIQLVNCYEALHGFPLTRCFRTILVNTDADVKDLFQKVKEHISIYYIVCSRKWIKSPYLLSMYFLILRSAFRFSAPPLTDKDVESIEAFEEFMKRSGKQLIPDKGYLMSSFKYWNKILQNYQNLFGRFSIEHNWDTNFNNMANEKTMRYEGIDKLCKAQCRSTRVLKLFNKYVVNSK